MEIEVRNPATGELSGRVTTSTDEEITGLADRARAAAERWARVPIRERARLLIRFHDRILENESQVLNTIQSETGKSRRDAFGELYSLAGTARYYAYHGPGHLQEQHVRGALPGVTGARLGWRPHRLVGLITPWNYPFLLSIGDALPALLAGCGVLLKPSERTPLSAILGRQFLCEAGLDPDLLGLVQGDGTQGENVIREVDYLAFTGGVKTGRKVAVASAHRMIGCSLELGGKNPMVVLEGSPVGNVVEGLVAGACANAGQACIGVERVYVAASLYDEFLHKASERFRSLKVGWSTDWTIDVGSLISPGHMEKVYGHVADAVEKGATVVTGGRKRPDLGPAFIDPTVLTDVSEDAMASREETFGPVVSVYPVRDMDEAIERANDSQYGLNASVWGPKTRVLETARRIQAGSVGIHSTLQIYNSFDVPMGGIKGSGLGRRHGAAGIRRFNKPQSIVTGSSMGGGYDSLWVRLRSPWVARLMLHSLRMWRHIPGIR